MNLIIHGSIVDLSSSDKSRMPYRYRLENIDINLFFKMTRLKTKITKEVIIDFIKESKFKEEDKKKHYYEIHEMGYKLYNRPGLVRPDDRLRSLQIVDFTEPDSQYGMRNEFDVEFEEDKK